MSQSASGPAQDREGDGDVQAEVRLHVASTPPPEFPATSGTESSTSARGDPMHSAETQGNPTQNAAPADREGDLSSARLLTEGRGRQVALRNRQ